MQKTDPLICALHDWIGIFMRHSMQDIILYSKANGLSISQIGALFRIRQKGATDVTDIGDELGVTSAAASQLLERLVHQGLIARTEDPHDRRVRKIALTEKGLCTLEESIKARQAWLENLASSMTQDEQVKVISALHILIEKANQIE